MLTGPITRILKFSSALVMLLLCAGIQRANATPITIMSNPTLSGSFDFDTSTLTLSNVSIVSSFGGEAFTSGFVSGSGPDVFAQFTGSFGDTLFIDFGNINIFGTISLPLGVQPFNVFVTGFSSALCGPNSSGCSDDLGSLNFDVGTTPEPSSLLLLGTGLLGLGPLLRRRLAKS